MKISQNDLIFSIVFLVLGIGFMVAFWFMKPIPAPVPDPTPVVLTPPALPGGSVSMANSLPGGTGSGSSGFGAPAGFGGGAGPMGPGGPGAGGAGNFKGRPGMVGSG